MGCGFAALGLGVKALCPPPVPDASRKGAKNAKEGSGPWRLFLIYAALIFCVSSIPGGWLGMPELLLDEKFIPLSLRENPDKYAHALAYAVFGWLGLRALMFGSALPPGKAAIAAFLISAVYGATDEWHQYFVPDRYCDVNDWLADCAGAFLMILLLVPWYRKKRVMTGK